VSGGPGIWRYPVLWIAELLIGTALVAAATLPVLRRRAERYDAHDPSLLV
jgi:hypothetical protein